MATNRSLSIRKINALKTLSELIGKTENEYRPLRGHSPELNEVRQLEMLVDDFRKYVKTETQKTQQLKTDNRKLKKELAELKKITPPVNAVSTIVVNEKAKP